MFVEQLKGFEVAEKKHIVYKLHKALYSLKQASRAWYRKMDAYFVEQGFHRSVNEHTLHTKSN